VATRLLYVSFKLPSLPRLLGENAMSGGLAPNALKKEKGDTLLLPFSDIVDTKAIGLGTTPPSNNL